MGWKDWFNRGKNVAAENKDAVNDGIDKVGDMVDEKTDGQHAEHVDKAQDAAKDYVEKLPEE